MIKLTFKEIIQLPFMLIPLLAYRTSTYKDRIEMDVDRFWTIHYGKKTSSYSIGIIRELVNCIEFRNLFFYRCGSIGRKLAHLSLFYLPTQKLLFFGVAREKFGGGAFIQHGYCTAITARSIGENFWVCRGVSISYSGNGCPIIGNNVFIGTGAIVTGNITIGDNVSVGAGTTVVRDVPNDTLVVSQKPRYIPKQNK